MDPIRAGFSVMDVDGSYIKSKYLNQYKPSPIGHVHCSLPTISSSTYANFHRYLIWGYQIQVLGAVSICHWWSYQGNPHDL